MQISKVKNLMGQLALLIATIVWGTSFFILKETISQIPTFYVLSLRFLPSAAILFLVCRKTTFKITKPTFLRGVVLGLFLAGAYITQTLGLNLTTSSRNAFITSAYVIMVPFFVWIAYKTPPKFKTIVSAVLCVCGIGLVSFSGGVGKTTINALIGDFLTLIGAVFFAFQIIFINKYQNQNDDAMQLLSVELLTVGVIFAAITLFIELPVNAVNGTLNVFALNGNQLLKIGYLMLFCTLTAQALQMIGQRYTTANQASLILSLEAVFGTFFSVTLGGEKLTLIMIIGFSLVFVSVLINELNFNFKKPLADIEDKKE